MERTLVWTLLSQSNTFDMYLPDTLGLLRACEERWRNEVDIRVLVPVTRHIDLPSRIKACLHPTMSIHISTSLVDYPDGPTRQLDDRTYPALAMNISSLSNSRFALCPNALTESNLLMFSSQQSTLTPGARLVMASIASAPPDVERAVMISLPGLRVASWCAASKPMPADQHEILFMLT